jgi:hypothetical protein
VLDVAHIISCFLVDEWLSNVAGVLNLVIGGFLIKSHIENNEISAQRDQLQLSITDPKTGYVARLAQAQNNVVTLTHALETQNSKFKEQSAASAVQLAETKRQLAEARAARADLQRKVDAFLNQKIEGETLEERIRDVDERAMKEFLND